MKRISRGTPYVLSQADIENALMGLRPRTEEAIASLMDMSPEKWRAQTKAKRASQIVHYQNSGQLAASIAAVAKAHTDLEDAAFTVTQITEAQSVTEDVAELKRKVADLVDLLRPVGKRGA